MTDLKEILFGTEWICLETTRLWAGIGTLDKLSRHKITSNMIYFQDPMYAEMNKYTIKTRTVPDMIRFIELYKIKVDISRREEYLKIELDALYSIKEASDE